MTKVSPILLKMAFVGNFKLTKSDNFDDFLKELGVGVIKRKVIMIGH